jgi:DNA-binding XRE family transcriptional regulator
MTLLSMKKPIRVVRAGRPVGSTTYEKAPAIAFGTVVRELRLEQGIAQEELAGMAGVERSHMGKIERGTHMPNLALILKLASALNCPPGLIVDATAEKLN